MKQNQRVVLICFAEEYNFCVINIITLCLSKFEVSSMSVSEKKLLAVL